MKFKEGQMALKHWSRRLDGKKIEVPNGDISHSSQVLTVLLYIDYGTEGVLLLYIKGGIR